MPTLMDRNPGGSGWALAVLLRARSCNHSTRDSASASDSSSSDESSRRALTQATDEQNDDGVCSRRTTSVSTSRVEQIRLRFVAIYGRRHCHDPPASIFRRYQQASNFFAASFAHGKPPLSTPLPRRTSVSIALTEGRRPFAAQRAQSLPARPASDGQFFLSVRGASSIATCCARVLRTQSALFRASMAHCGRLGMLLERRPHLILLLE